MKKPPSAGAGRANMLSAVILMRHYTPEEGSAAAVKFCDGVEDYVCLTWTQRDGGSDATFII